MKKEFFVTLMPVPGEIQEGETGYSINNAIYTHHTSLGCEYGRKVEMFLCTHNIKNASNVWRMDNMKEYEHYPGLNNMGDDYTFIIPLGEKTGKHVLIDQLFAVITKVSPIARTYLTNWQEFSEEELMFQIPGVAGTADLKYDHIQPGKHGRYLAVFPCPTCGIYH